MARKGGLGRGVDVLLNLAEAVQASPEPAPRESLRQLGVERLRRGRFQPRDDMREDSLQELAESIRAQGLVQPIVVRPLGADEFEIVAGERRWRAAQMAGLETVPAVVRDVTDDMAVAMGLIENIQREDLNPLEEAAGLRRLVDEFGLTHEDAAGAVGRSRSAVSNLLRLLELAPPVQRMLRDRRLEMGHARALLGLEEDLQLEAARQVNIHGLSVRETEDLVRRLTGGSGRTGKTSRGVDPDVQRLQDRLSERLGARVQVRQGNDGKGRLVIHYNSLDELDGIIQHVL